MVLLVRQSCKKERLSYNTKYTHFAKFFEGYDHISVFGQGGSYIK